jgi:hypothetical protein
LVKLIGIGDMLGEMDGEFGEGETVEVEDSG